MSDRIRTSAVRVFGKSMHTLSAGWMAAVAWLWIAEVQQQLLRHGAPPPQYGARTLLSGLIPASLLACAGLVCSRWAGAAPTQVVERREWWHAFWWSVIPNALLIGTVWVMLQEAR
jgi:hypothetical protein